MRYQTDFVIEPFKPKSAKYKQGPRRDKGGKHVYPKNRRSRADKEKSHSYPAKRFKKPDSYSLLLFM